MKESTLRDILISYERKETKLKSFWNKENDVYKQIPQVKEIEDEINKVGLEMMKLVLKILQIKKLFRWKQKKKFKL